MPDAPLVSFGNFSHTRTVLASNAKEFRYELIWAKKRSVSGLHAHKRPAPAHEFLSVFGPPGSFYQSIREPSEHRPRTRTQRRANTLLGIRARDEMQFTASDSMRHPLSVRLYAADNLSRNGAPDNKQTCHHSTQKPVSLLSWIVGSYSRAEMSVLDPTSGGASTALAALSCGRHVTCIEKDPQYFTASAERVRKHVADSRIDATIEVRQ